MDGKKERRRKKASESDTLIGRHSNASLRNDKQGTFALLITLFYTIKNVITIGYESPYNVVGVGVRATKKYIVDGSETSEERCEGVGREVPRKM